MENKTIQVTLRAESPVAILQSRASQQFARTLDYLPGSAVRGAFAEIILNKKGSADPVFQQIFVDQQILFSDFLPAYGTSQPKLLPTTAAACKRHGLKHTDSLRDRLIDMMLEPGAAKPEDVPTCICGGRLDSIGGKYILMSEPTESAQPKRQLRMHVGISRQRGTSQQGLLFSYQMLIDKPVQRKSPDGTKTIIEREPLRFIGQLVAKGETADQLLAELEKIVPDRREHLSVGKARTRGLGELVIESRTPIAAASDFADRWKKFNDKVQHPSPANSSYFSITLQSHLILRDALGMPVLDQITAAHLGFPDDLKSAKCVAANLNRVTVSGWNAAQGLPKPDTVALARGSVLGFKIDKAKEKQAMAHLQQIETDGLGERRAEGFGRISVCDPFHSQYHRS